MRIAVTGGIGFIGQSVISLAQQMGHDVICVDYVSARLKSYEKARLPILQGSVYRTLSRCFDVMEPNEFLNVLFEKDDRHLPQVVIHLGAVVDTGSGIDDKNITLWQENVDYTRQLTRAASNAGCHVVFASSAAVYGAVPNYGSPCNPYGLTKSIGEALLNQMKTRTTALRFFNVYGKYEHHKGAMASMPFKLARAYETNGTFGRAPQTFEMHSPDARRDFISVEWVAKAVMKSVDELMGPRKDMSNQHITYDVGTGCSMSFKELDAALRHIFCADSIVKWGSLPAQLIGRYQDHTKAGTGAKLICTFETGPTAVEQMRYTYGVSDV